jgi:hypothetical protein
MRLPSIALAAITIALVAALGHTGSAAGHPAIGEAAGGPVIASATGSGHFTVANELRTFSFTAREYADGTASGQAQLRNRSAANTPIHMALDCLRVTGNTATMTGTVTSIGTPAPPFFVVGSRIDFTVMDNGEGQAPPDLISLVRFYGQIPPLNCNVQFSTPTNPVEEGNVQVHG